MKKMNKKGFTIVELVIVIAVIAILAAVLIPTFSGIVDRANKSAALQEVKNAYTATVAEELSTPDTADDKITEITTVFNVKAANGKFVTITAKGEVKASEGNSAEYTVKDGKIVCIDHSTYTTNGSKCTCSKCSDTHDFVAKEGAANTCNTCSAVKQ